MTLLDESPPASRSPDARASGAPQSHPGGRFGAGWVAFCATPWRMVTLFTVLACTATLSNSSGQYIGDNRFEQYWNPARRVARSFTVWDGTRGLGRVREDFWPGGTIPMAVFRALGANPILTEHLWHALLLVVAGTGMVEVMRLFQPRRSLEHLLAGLALMFGAYSATFLTPFSNLYLQFAMAPWLIVAFARGLTSDRPWRWSGVFALLVLVPGNVDIPGLVYNMLPLVPLSLYLLLVERTVSFRRYVGWVAVTGGLTLVTNAAVLAKIYLGAAAFNQRLNDTEAAEISFRASSWPESARGLGNWLSYFRDNGQLLKPQFASYFDNPWVILCTFVPVLLAFLAFWLSQWRPRILFAGFALFSLFVLVGAFPLSAPAPVGVRILDAFNKIPFLTAFRNTYKVGSGLAIGVSALFGYCVAATARRIAVIDKQLAAIPIAVAAIAMSVTAFPFWSGNLYNENQQFRDVPRYWTDAFTWLDSQAGDDRVLILPMTSRSRYRWGWVGDDIFDALLTRRHTVATGVPLSTPQAANLIETVSFNASDPAYREGTLGPILRRLGIRYVLLRNDLDWKAVKRPRPAAFEGIRHDADLSRVATFGAPGENTTAEGDTGKDAEAERGLPPVEIYELHQPGPPDVRMVAQQAPLLVAGDGAAWTSLALGGYLKGDVPVEYTGAFAPDDLRAALESGASVIVTDTNRRRLRVMLSYEPDYSYILGDGQSLDVGRSVRGLFDVPGNEAVWWSQDASQIGLTGPPRTTDGSQPWYRPSNAFDGNPNTIWSIRKTELPVGRRFQVYLRNPKHVTSTRVDIPVLGGDGQGIQELTMSFSDGSTEIVNLRGAKVIPGTNIRRVELPMPDKYTSYIGIAITAVDPNANSAGIADITFPGLDLREFVQAPSDVQLLATQRSDIGELAAKAPFGFLFLRQQGTGPVDEETTVRRRFLVINERPFLLTGDVRVRESTSDEGINRLIPRAITASGSRRFEGDVQNWGGYAVDGSADTSWVSPARPGEVLNLQLRDSTANAVTSVSMSASKAAGFSVPKKVTVLAGDAEYPLDLTAYQPCPAGGSTQGCRAGSVELPAVQASDVRIRIDEIEGQSTKLKVDEVRLNGQPNPPLDLDAEQSSCHDVGLTVGPEGAARQSLQVRFKGSLRELLDGKTIAYEACSPVRLRNGWQLLDAGDNSALDRIDLTAADVSAPRPKPGSGLSWQVTQESPTLYRVEAEAPNGALLVLQQSFAPGWVATVNGRRLGAPDSFDTMNGWVIDDRGRLDIEIRYTGQRWFNLSLVVTAVGLVSCGLLIVRSRPQQGRVRAQHKVRRSARG